MWAYYRSASAIARSLLNVRTASKKYHLAKFCSESINLNADKQIKPVSDFESCFSYLKYRLQLPDADGKALDSSKWRDVLDEIVDTLPARTLAELHGEEHEEGDGADEADEEPEDVGSTPWLSTPAMRAKMKLKTCGRLRATVKPFASDAFILEVCKDQGAPVTAMSYISFMVSEKRPIRDPHWHMFLSLLSRCDDLDSEKRTEALALCQMAQKKMSSLLPDTQRLLVAALAIFRGHEEALSVLSEGVKADFHEDSNFSLIGPMAAMAKDALRDLDFDMALKFMMDQRFHVHHMAVRESLNVHNARSIDQVYIHWIRACEKIKLSSGFPEAFEKLEMLFKYFGDYSVVVRPDVETKIKEFFIDSKEVGVKLTSLANRGQCVSCGQCVSPPQLAMDNFLAIKEVAMQKLFLKTDVYHSTSPTELNGFMRFILNRVGQFDTVVDGLNLGLSRTPRGESRTKPFQSHCLLEGLKSLIAMGRKPLVIHRYELHKYNNAKEILDLCPVFTLNRVSKDDLFIILATLHGGPGTLFVTNDTFREHHFALDDRSLQRHFTRWQLMNRVTHFVDRSRHNLGVQFKLPVHNRLEATKDGNRWHLPLENDTSTGPYIQLTTPQKWLCVTHK